MPRWLTDPQTGPGLAMAGSSTWPRNRLLLALPASNLKRLLPQLEAIPCEREQVLLDADSALEHIYFPDNGVVSVLAVYEDGSMIEMATVGREGCTGFQAIFGDQESSVRFLVQIPGSATQMSRADFMRAIKSMPAFRNLMYIQAFLEQVLVSGACNGSHSLKERLARWLLMMCDRSEDDNLQITQTLLAQMLGVQRPPVTNALRQFKRDGLIRVGRGQIVVVDRQGLSKESCECYRVVRRRISAYLPKSFD